MHTKKNKILLAKISFPLIWILLTPLIYVKAILYLVNYATIALEFLCAKLFPVSYELYSITDSVQSMFLGGSMLVMVSYWFLGLLIGFEIINSIEERG